MTDVSTGRSTPRRENRHDQAVLSDEVRRLAAVLRAGGARQRVTLRGSRTPSAGGRGAFDRALTEALRDTKHERSTGLQENNRSSEEPMSPEQQEHHNEPEQRKKRGLRGEPG